MRPGGGAWGEARGRGSHNQYMSTVHLQLASVHEDLQQRELRWSNTLTRYRRKIELLENQNKELQSDLKVMEQERLKWWQKQVTVSYW